MKRILMPCMSWYVIIGDVLLKVADSHHRVCCLKQLTVIMTSLGMTHTVGNFLHKLQT